MTARYMYIYVYIYIYLNPIYIGTIYLASIAQVSVWFSIFGMNLSILISTQLTEVGTMNIFVHWINEDGGKRNILAL